MLANREAAKMLEDIAGPSNFSEDPAIICTYTLQPFGGMIGVVSKDLFDKIQIGAVIMPGNREEVQAIIKVCNKYKIGFKAHSTGLGAHGVPSRPGSLQLDMRRMNRIIDLNERNMYAVVEPYVSARELEVEAMKKGLLCHIIGAGSHTSILATTTSHLGHGHSAITTSNSARNCLGAELVLPTGDIVRWGLVEEGKTGHPGPGFYGLHRGTCGAFGSLGVFTKAAVKLFPWPGPTQLEMTGKSPTPGYKVPDNMRVSFWAFPNTEKLGDAIYKLAEAEIGYMIWALPLFMFPQRCMGDSNDDQYEVWKQFKKLGVIDTNLDQLTVVLASRTKKEMEYKEKVLEAIISETNGQEFLAGLLAKDAIEKMFCHLIAVHKPCTEFRLSGGDLGTSYLQLMHFDSHMKAKKKIRDIQKPYVDKGILTDVACESGWGGPMEQKALGHMEYVNFTDPLDPELVKGQIAYVRETVDFAIKEKLLGTGIVAGGRGETDKALSPHLGDYMKYKEKIRNILDPNGVSDPLLYLG